MVIMTKYSKIPPQYLRRWGSFSGIKLKKKKTKHGITQTKYFYV